MFYSPYGNDDNFVEVSLSQVNRNDYLLVEEWIIFDRLNNPGNLYASERSNFMAWDIAIKNIDYHNGIVFKITSHLDGHRRLEGLVHLELNENNEIIIEALEVAPWNRTSYLGEKREFRKLGLILIANSILYGFSIKFCGTIRLESLEVREEYYRNGLNMYEYNNGSFTYSLVDCLEFIHLLKEEGFLRVGRDYHG